MTILAVIIGDYCSEVMPWWYCALFTVPVFLTAVCLVVFIFAAIRLERHTRQRAQDLTDPQAWDKRVIVGRPAGDR